MKHRSWALVALIILSSITLTNCKGKESPTEPKVVFVGTFAGEACGEAKAECPNGTTAYAKSCAYVSVTVSSASGECNSQSSCDAKAKEKAEAEMKAKALAEANVKCGSTTCTYTGQATYTFPAGPQNGLTVSVSPVQTGCGPCTTVPTNLPPWIVNFRSLGNGTFAFDLATNAEFQTFSLTLCGFIVTINHATPACNYIANPPNHTFAYNDLQPRMITVTKSSPSCLDCTSIPAGLPSWLTVTSQLDGNFLAAPNSLNTTGQPRSATLSFCGAPPHTITQNPEPPAACAVVSVSPSTVMFPWQGGSANTKTVTITFNRADCTCTNIVVPSWTTYSVNGNQLYLTAGQNGTVQRDGTGSVCSFPITLLQDPKPDNQCTPVSITSEPESRTITSGQSATLSVTATGTTPISYQWYIGTSGNTSSPISGATGPSVTVSPSSTTSYWVRVSNGCGTDSSATAMVTVNPACTPVSITSEPESRTITSGQSATLSVTATGTTPISYQWYIGTSGNTSSPISGATGPSVTVSPSSTTSYWVRVSNGCGTDSSATAMVTVQLPPTPATLSWRLCQNDPKYLSDCSPVGADKQSSYSVAKDRDFVIFAMVSHDSRPQCTISGRISSNIGDGDDYINPQPEAGAPNPIWLGHGFHTNNSGAHTVSLQFYEECSGSSRPLSGVVTINVQP